MHIICGLGNPGEEYEHTRHNAGFDSVDALAEGTARELLEERMRRPYSENDVQGRRFASGKASGLHEYLGGPLKKVCQAYSATADDVIVIHDELDIDPGTIRVKHGGGLAGHNGLKSIADKRRRKTGRAFAWALDARRDACQWSIGYLAVPRRRGGTISCRARTSRARRRCSISRAVWRKPSSDSTNARKDGFDAVLSICR